VIAHKIVMNDALELFIATQAPHKVVWERLPLYGAGCTCWPAIDVSRVYVKLPTDMVVVDDYWLFEDEAAKVLAMAEV